MNSKRRSCGEPATGVSQVMNVLPVRVVVSIEQSHATLGAAHPVTTNGPGTSA